jgi:hypothetical protein
MQTNPNMRQAHGVCITPGDRVRIFDDLEQAYRWHTVSEVITGTQPQIRVPAYDFFISAARVSSHRKGAAC